MLQELSYDPANDDNYDYYYQYIIGSYSSNTASLACMMQRK